MFLLIKLYSGWIWCSFVAKWISTVSQELLPCGDKYSIFYYFWLKKKTFWKFGLSSTYLVVTYLVSFILWFPTISLLFSYQCLPTCYLPEHYWTLDYVFPSSHDKYYLPYSSASNSSIRSTHVYTYQLYSPVVFSILSSFILCHHPPLPGSIDIPASQAHILFALQFLTSCEVYAMCPLGYFFLSLSSLGPSSLSAHEL